MISRAAIATCLCGLATPCLATEWVNCASPDGGASFDYLAGATEVLSIAGMTITVADKVWATDPAYGPGDPVAVGQAFETGTMVFIDAVDPGVTTRLAELRLFKAAEGDLVVAAGTLRIPGEGAWPVTCSGP